ncbi:C3 and PZP-like alpha-2-macroglobulin domain-containing protein 8 [Cimex lectularius]|uniref:C3 and PZP-like alpha-2-macroglobulin domain-containing protein 8 n=1 Tax=Cimex lectularius TaxID=79782 RepID=A0A8I6RFK3_CIMLE|nr:C3 and PZP-like alpha-2-macroglobulin domain-containing protein 8 [Cimex lectularius]
MKKNDKDLAGAMLSLFVLLIAPSAVISVQECTRISVVCPEVGVPGQSTAVLVSLGRNEPTNVTLRLVSSDSTELLAQSTALIQGEGSVGVPIPGQAQNKLNLEIHMECDLEKSSCKPHALCPLSLIGPVRDVIVRPRSKYYKPGETIEFWVLALDHELRLANDIIGNVHVRDPTGTRIAIWEQIPLNDGVKSFEAVISPEARLGLWRLEAEVEEAVFKTEINVSLTRGSKDPVAPELPIAEEHFVELRFSRDMRRRYKPGLPFVGKVEAVSSEKAVRVRVKVLDNTTSIYSQDIEMAGGEGSFLVPAILSDSDLITLQTELVSVEGKEIDSHYVLAREPVYKWNSTSTCYLLAEGMEASLKPGDDAKTVILSSCPCDRPLHYIVSTEGHLTYWDEGHVPAVNIPQDANLNPSSLCRFNLSFKVEAVMAPVSHLLVYYVTDEGEPISDVISFDVKLIHRQITLNLEQKKFWFPAEEMDVQVLADLQSLFCLVGGRGGDLNTQKISEGLELDFTEAGVGFYQRSCLGEGNTTNKMTLRSNKTLPHHSVMSDSGLDQLWLWKCFNYTAEIEARGVRVPSPPEPGKWSMFALSVSPVVGLRFSSPIPIQVFRPLEVDFKLPGALRVGESLEVDIKIGNNLNSCVDVNALLTVGEGAHFLGSSQPFVAEKLRLGPHGATSLVVRIVATTSGKKNMTVEVSAYHSETCQTVSSGLASNHSLVGTVVKQRGILINPEGLVKTHIESAYFCANEQMVISTPEKFSYQFIPAPRNREGVIFEVRAGMGVHVAISEIQDVSQRMYQTVIGDLDNTVSWIGRGKHGYSVRLVTASTPQILSHDESRTFWLSWDRGALSFGVGSGIHERAKLKWKLEKKMKVNYIGFATSWGQPADVRIWNFNDEAGFSQVIHLDIPRSVLPGSETGTLLVAGGLHLPYVVSDPRPSLSEFSSLATTVSMIAPLLTEHQHFLNQSDTPEQKQRADKIYSKIQNLLLFKMNDSSFSDHSSMTSQWSSVEVLDLLNRAQTVVRVDSDLISNLKSWIESKQSQDGSFKPHFIDIEPDNQTSVGEPAKTIATTAQTLNALLAVGIEDQKDIDAVTRAREYLENQVGADMMVDGVTLASLCLALVEARSPKAHLALDLLKNASTNEEGEFGWPRQRDNSDWLYEEGVEQKRQPVTSHLKEFKASLYALMTYTHLKDLKSAEPVARYLFYRSNILDTHTELISTAVKAFSEFAKLALDENRWLTVSLATSGMELTDTLELRPDTPPQILNLPSLPTKVFVYATGGGCATVQGRMSYATYYPSRSNSLLDLWAGVTEEILPRRNSIQELEGKLPVLNLKTCFRWKGGEPSGVIRLEIHLFSGFELSSVVPNKLDMDYGSRGDRVWFVVSNVSSSCAVCIEFSAKSEYIVSRMRPAFARVYPAGRADLVSELFFHTRKGSPLLAATSEDDLITWFGSTRAGEFDGMSSDFSNICPCGQDCKDIGTTTRMPMTSVQVSDDDERQSGVDDFTDIIVFSDLHENLSTTEGEFGSIEDITRELGFNSTSETLYFERESIRTTQVTPSSLPISTKKPDRKKGTLEKKPAKKAPVLEKGFLRSKHIDLPPFKAPLRIDQDGISLNTELKTGLPEALKTTTESIDNMNPVKTAQLAKEHASLRTPVSDLLREGSPKESSGG